MAFETFPVMAAVAIAIIVVVLSAQRIIQHGQVKQEDSRSDRPAFIYRRRSR